METLRTYLPLTGWDLEWVWDQVAKYTRQGLDQLMRESERADGIDKLILAMHVYDRLPEEGFILYGVGDKTAHLLFWVPCILQRPARDIAQRLSDHALASESFQQDFRDLGYFIYFIRLFYCFAQHTMGRADNLFSSVFRASVERYRALLRYAHLRLGLMSRVYELEKQLLWDDIMMVRIEGSMNAALCAEQLKGRLFLDMWYMKTLPATTIKDWQTKEIEIDIPGTIGKAVPDSCTWFSAPSPRPKLLDFPIYSPGQLRAYMESALSGMGPLPAIGISPSDIEAISSLIPADTVYISYLQINDFLFVLAMRRDAPPTFFGSQTLEGGEDSEDPIECEYRRVIILLRALADAGVPVHQRSTSRGAGTNDSNGKDAAVSVLRDLYDLVVRDARCNIGSGHDGQSLETYLQGARTILLSNAFPVQGIPFGALHNGTRHLIEDACVAYIPNVTWWTQACGGSFSLGKALVLADPHANLPNALAEGHDVAGLLEGRGISTVLKVGPDVNLQSVLKTIGEVDLVHYAGHGSFALDSSSFLDLADGNYTMQHILNAPWRPRFAFLNACRTGQRQVHFVEETLSIASAMLAAGTRSVICTLWPVEDRTAACFSRAFYRKLLGGDSVGVAYTQAMSLLVCAGLHPAEWAGYVLAGDPHMVITEVIERDPERAGLKPVR